MKDGVGKQVGTQGAAAPLERKCSVRRAVFIAAIGVAVFIRAGRCEKRKRADDGSSQQKR